MANKKQVPQPLSKVLSTEDLRAGIRKLERRINDLLKFDLATIEERFDSKAEAIRVKVNDTLADIFGLNTPQ